MDQVLIAELFFVDRAETPTLPTATSYLSTTVDAAVIAYNRHNEAWRFNDTITINKSILEWTLAGSYV